MNNYQLAGPPRQVPIPIRTQVWFGGFSGQFGWLFFGFGMVFAWVFGLTADYSSLYFALRPTETAPGLISAVEGTGASENDTPVYANTFTFRVERQEKAYQGVSYTTGQRYSVGDNVTIEYPRSNPNRARIKGARGGQFGIWVLCLVGIFPAVGLVFIIFGLSRGINNNHLLANGKVTVGQLVSKEPTNTRINNQTVYKLTFEFTAEDGMPYQATAHSHTPASLEDEAEEQILYDPHNPNRAVLVDNMPGQPDIDEFGQIYAANPTGGVKLLILPFATILIHGTIFLYVLLRL